MRYLRKEPTVWMVGMTADFSWGTFDHAFVDELAAALAGMRVLEVFAGNGMLSAKLAERGVDVLATSLFSSHDGSINGMHHPVLEMRAAEAARTHGDRDVLLMCWPPSDEAAAQAALLWGEERPLVFIGEVTDFESGSLGGCASDLFFELSDVRREFAAYRSDRSGLDRAQLRSMRPGSTAEYVARIEAAHAAMRLPS